MNLCCLVFINSAHENELPMVVRRQIFRYYKQCVQRHLYARALPFAFISTNKAKAKTRKLAVDVVNKQQHRQQTTSLPLSPPKLIFISKNPAFTMRLDMLYDTFPDGRVVCLLRDPCQSIPSMISYIAHVWETFASPIQQVEK